MSVEDDDREMEEMEPSHDDLLDVEPTKQEKIEVRQENEKNHSDDGTLATEFHHEHRCILALLDSMSTFVSSFHVGRSSKICWRRLR
jgi:hypothetical protein